VATRLFSDDQLERLRSFPDIGRDELIRFFTLTPADVAFVDPGRGRGPADRLGLAVQLCALPWLGFVPDDVRSAPRVAVARLAARLSVDPDALASYGRRKQTRTDHLRLAADYLGWSSAPPGSMRMKELEEFLQARAMEHDSPTLLFNLAADYLISARTIRPGVVTLMEMVAAARAAATALTFEKVAALLTGERTAELDGLLVYDAGLKMTRLAWLTKPPTDPTASGVRAELEKLAFLRGLDAHRLDVSMLPAERWRFLASVGRRSTNQAMQRRDPQRRYPILLTPLAQSSVDVLDDVVALFDQAVSARESRAKTKTDAELIERAKQGEARQLLMTEILPVLADPSVPDEDVGGLLRERIGMRVLCQMWAAPWSKLPRDHGRLAALEGSYSYLRQFTPGVLAAIDFHGGAGAGELMEAVTILKELNRTGGRKVPTHAPTGFVPARYAEYLAQADRDGEDTAYRHYWELCVMLALRDGLRSGDVYVPGSRRYADPATYLFTRDQWLPRRTEFCALVGKPAGAQDAIAQGKQELHAALADLETALAAARPGDTGAVRLDDDGRLVIPPLTAEDVPAEAKALREELAGMLPFAPIASLLIELDVRTGFLDCFTHAGKQARSPELKRNILAVLIANATNLGLTRMAEACGVPADVLAWTQEWYVREDILREANTVIVNYHHSLELTKVFGGGTMSSSDGQRFPVRGKTLTGRDMVVHGGQVLSTYTHVSDQHSTYGTKVIIPTTREAHYVLDDLLGNATDLPIREQATDTHGVTLVNFALFDLVGMQLSPRIRDLGNITMVRNDTPTVTSQRYRHAGPLLTARWNEGLVRDCWDDLLRMAASLKYGQATASLIVGKWSAASRQNTLAAALKEWGLLQKDRARRRIPRRPRLPEEDRPAAQQGRERARAAPLPALRPAGHHRQIAPGGPDRASLVPDRTDQRGDHLVDRVLLPGGRPAARPGPRRPRRAAGAHLPCAQREHRLLRRHHRRRRGGTRQTQPGRRLAPAAPAGHRPALDLTPPRA
jgi:TnpA family transposase